MSICALPTWSLADVTSLPGTITPWFSLLEIAQPTVTPNPELQDTHFQSYAASSGWTASQPQLLSTHLLIWDDQIIARLSAVVD